MAAQKACLEWSRERAQNWLKILDPALARAEEPVPVRPQIHYRRLPRCGLRLARRDHPHGFRELSEHQALARNMKKLKSWPSVNEVFYGFQAW